jgi:hypothetical protein
MDMRYFLLIYNQKTGEVQTEEFPRSAGRLALDRRFELEDEYQNDPAIEVVLLGAASRDDLLKTHARYFKTPRELVAHAV